MARYSLSGFIFTCLCLMKINSLLMKYYAISHSDSCSKCYLFHPRYLHNDIFMYMTREITHDISCCYFTLYCQAHYPCSYSNRPNFSNFLSFTATFLWYTRLFTLLNRVRAAAKISAGGVGSPYNQLYRL